MQKYIS